MSGCDWSACFWQTQREDTDRAHWKSASKRACSRSSAVAVRACHAAPDCMRQSTMSVEIDVPRCCRKRSCRWSCSRRPSPTAAPEAVQISFFVKFTFDFSAGTGAVRGAAAGVRATGGAAAVQVRWRPRRCAFQPSPQCFDVKLEVCRQPRRCVHTATETTVHCNRSVFLPLH